MRRKSMKRFVVTYYIYVRLHKPRDCHFQMTLSQYFAKNVSECGLIYPHYLTCIYFIASKGKAEFYLEGCAAV
jgi:putative component of membrane protein insertase Oxa1/YidC/SpoIIIJ protein YidD